jgi:competence protein ComEA
MKKMYRTCLAVFVAMVMPMLALAGPVNVNSADAETISAELKGVGLARAQAIVEYRKANGPFRSVDDLVLVKGIGERTIEINRANILLDGGGKAGK